MKPTQKHGQDVPASTALVEHSSADTGKPSGDMLSRRGAMALAKRLQAYWHARGHRSVRFWAEPIEERFEKIGTYEIYRVV